MSDVPFPRTLAYVLRDQLAGEPLRLLVAEVVSTPDARHVQVKIGGTNFTVPRLKSYSAPAAGDPAFLLVGPALILAIGSVK